VFELNLCLSCVIIAAQRDDFKAFVVASNGIMSLLFCENRRCCSKVVEEICRRRHSIIDFFFVCVCVCVSVCGQGAKSTTECHKVTRESVGKK